MHHLWRIEITTDGRFYPGHPGYQVVCEDCGPVGVPQEDPRDARAIANRHEEVGGFERAHAEHVAQAFGDLDPFYMADLSQRSQTDMDKG